MSGQGHFVNESSPSAAYPYSLCCPDNWGGGDGDVSFRFAEFIPPLVNGSNHVSIPNSLITSFTGEVRLGTEACSARGACLADEACVFKMNDPDNAHIADCVNSSMPNPNAYVNSLCCEVKEVCWDSIDNDGDGYIDCADQDCWGGAAGLNPGRPQECTLNVSNVYTSSYMTTEGCVVEYNYTSNSTIFNPDCYAQPPVPPGPETRYCGFGESDDPAIDPIGVCCPYEWIPVKNALDEWTCIETDQCGVGALPFECGWDFDYNETYRQNWLNSEFDSSNPTRWCNSQIPELHSPGLQNAPRSTGCCLIPKFGTMDYWTDEGNVKIWG